MPQYILSNAQQKDLLIRKTPVILALPAPPDEPADPVDWARSVLQEDVRELITGVRLELLQVAPYPAGPRDTLTQLLGAIVEEPPADQWTIWVDAALVTLAPQYPRHPAGKPQWPLAVLIGGRRVPPKVDQTA
jgi:hypothetical protein